MHTEETKVCVVLRMCQVTYITDYFKYIEIKEYLPLSKHALGFTGGDVHTLVSVYKLKMLPSMNTLCENIQ